MLTENDFTTNEWVGCGGLHMVPLCATIIDKCVKRPVSLIDMGCGCGAIGIALLYARLIDELVMVDVDVPSVKFARQNAERLLQPDLLSRTRVHQADVWQQEQGPLEEEPVDVIVCNAPLSAAPVSTVSRASHNPERYYNHDWNFQRKIFSWLGHYLKPDGIIIIKDLISTTWWNEFEGVVLVSTVTGNGTTLQLSDRFFTYEGVNLFPPVSQLDVQPNSHCLRIFRQRR